MLIAERRRTHVPKLDRALAGAVHEDAAVQRMILRRRNHLRHASQSMGLTAWERNLGQLLHIGGLDVEDVEALVADAQIPHIDPEVVG